MKLMQYSLKRIALQPRAYENLYVQKTYFLYIQCTKTTIYAIFLDLAKVIAAILTTRTARTINGAVK